MVCPQIGAVYASLGAGAAGRLPRQRLATGGGVVLYCYCRHVTFVRGTADEINILWSGVLEWHASVSHV